MENLIEKNGDNFGQGYWVVCHKSAIDREKKELLQKLYECDSECGRYKTEYYFMIDYLDIDGIDGCVRLEIMFKVDRSKIVRDWQ